MKPAVVRQPSTGLRGHPLALTLAIASVVAVVALVLEHGFSRPLLPAGFLEGVQMLVVGLYLASQIVGVVRTDDRRAALRRRWLDLLLIVGCAVVLVAEFELTGQPVLKATTVYVVTLQAALLARFAVAFARFNLALAEGRLRPGLVVVLSFVAVIVVGAALLALPAAVPAELRGEEGHYFARHLLNCLFTSVSATCVTGLSVFDNTGSDFTRFGQVVILGLIQLGGLGIMIFGGLFGILLGRQLSLRQSLALQDALSHQTLGQVRRMVIFVVAVTLVCEVVGALVLYPMWPAEVGSRGDRFFYSVFHAVSAFCNAGFSLQSDSFVGYRGEWQVYGVILPLIVLGGLGFPVLTDLYHAAGARLARARILADTGGIVLPRGRRRARFARLSLHTKLVLGSTLLLIVVPALGYYVLESRYGLDVSARPPEMAGLLSPAMAELDAGSRGEAALFQSVTCRTAGFNTVAQDTESLSPGGMFLTLVLMFIGGSPASTAGGVKTISIAVLVLAVYSTLRGRPRVEVFGRTIPREVISRASVVIMAMFGLVSVVTLLLCATERGASLAAILFESVSACGTVGLSAGLTPSLTVLGRVIIILAMFAGRVGPLTVLVVLAGGSSPVRYEYPEESPVIG